jgi:hypothetical protein
MVRRFRTNHHDESKLGCGTLRQRRDADVFLADLLGRRASPGPRPSAEQSPDEAVADTLQEGAGGPYLVVVDERLQPLRAGEYAFHQGEQREHGQLDANGRASFGAVDPSRPFVFEVRDRVCVIRTGACFDPDDPKIEYGGTWFDWTLVRDDKRADTDFWPIYHREMDLVVRPGIDRFAQHEHITRRPIRIARPFLARLGEVRIRATPVQVRVGPFVRYTDHERATIWLETETPAMVHVRCRRAGAAAESSRYAATVRVGGRHFAAVELDGLAADAFHEYTFELAPLPASGAIPVAQQDLAAAFPELTPAVDRAMDEQVAAASLDQHGWLTFRTLRRVYDDGLRFATGSCRMYPGDQHDGKSSGPDMLHGLGDWLRATPKDKWPHFSFFCGDQIYSDEMGDDHGRMLISGRFAARIPGPADPAAAGRERLVDGAWAGRFAHRFAPYVEPGVKQVEAVRSGLAQLDRIHARYPDIKGIYLEYPDADPRERLKWRHRMLEGRRRNTGATREASDERDAREAVALLPVVDRLQISSEPFRAFVSHWEAGFGIALRRNPTANRYLCRNLLLWSIPDFEHQLPTVAEHGSTTVVRAPDQHGHPSANGGKHAADFAEYAYLYERSWTSSRSVRVLLAQVPTFLMFDDHELTDDWNFDVSWVRMLHNPKDDLRMWPKTLTDALAAYWVYQGWGNKAPSQWKNDPRAAALADAQRDGIDALPRLRTCIHDACFRNAPSQDASAAYQSGLGLEWHYRLPFDPPFLVPDCRSRRRMVPADEKLRVIDHHVSANAPKSQTIDDAQIAWLREILVDRWRGGPVAFIATSTPLLMQKKVMRMMVAPEIAARAWAGGTDVASILAVVGDSTALGTGSDALLHLFRRRKDLEHAIRDKTWRDLWALADAMRRANSPVKTLVVVSGDVHHNYSMTANLPGAGRPRPELLQITCSGLQTDIRQDLQESIAERQGSVAFDVGRFRLVPGFVRKQGTGSPDLVLYQNAAAVVTATMGGEVSVRVDYLSSSATDYLSGKEIHVYRYTSGPTYVSPGVVRPEEAEALAPTSPGS